MGKLDSLRADVDEATKKFEDCQDAYATELFTFMSKEQYYTEKLQDVSTLNSVHLYVHVCVSKGMCFPSLFPFPVSLLLTSSLLQFVRRQVAMLKQGVASLEGMLPTIEKKMSESSLVLCLMDYTISKSSRVFRFMDYIVKSIN